MVKKHNEQTTTMNKKLIFIIIGLTFLTTALFVGTPFEFLEVTVDTIATSILIILFFLLFIILFKQIWRIDNKVFKWTAFGLLTILAIPYFLIGLQTALLTWSKNHPMWQDLIIYTNDKNEKVISQWRETSSSVYDCRDRKIIADYGKFRISFDCNVENLIGTWKEYDIRNKKTTITNFDDKKK